MRRTAWQVTLGCALGIAHGAWCVDSPAPRAGEARSVARAIVAQPLVDADVLEPSVQNEVCHALSLAPTNAPPCAMSPREAEAALVGTNALDATARAIALVSAQRADGRWAVGTNDLTSAAVEILLSISGEE